MISVDNWTFKCSRCDWTVASERTVNNQQSLAAALIRAHIQKHDAAAIPDLPPRSDGAPQRAELDLDFDDLRYGLTAAVEPLAESFKASGHRWSEADIDMFIDSVRSRAGIAADVLQILENWALRSSRTPSPIRDVLGEMSMRAFREQHANDAPVHPNERVRYSQIDMDTATKPLHARIEQLEALIAQQVPRTPSPQDETRCQQCGAVVSWQVERDLYHCFSCGHESEFARIGSHPSSQP